MGAEEVPCNMKIKADVHDNLICPGDDHKRPNAVRISILGLT